MNEDKNWDELMDMWWEQPETARTMFPSGLTYAVTKDDTLASLSDQWGVPWESIAEATMGVSKPEDINTWLAENGGRKLPSGYWAFMPGQEIVIPPPEEESDFEDYEEEEDAS